MGLILVRLDVPRGVAGPFVMGEVVLVLIGGEGALRVDVGTEGQLARAVDVDRVVVALGQGCGLEERGGVDEPRVGQRRVDDGGREGGGHLRVRIEVPRGDLEVRGGSVGGRDHDAHIRDVEVVQQTELDRRVLTGEAGEERAGRHAVLLGPVGGGGGRRGAACQNGRAEDGGGEAGGVEANGGHGAPQIGRGRTAQQSGDVGHAAVRTLRSVWKVTERRDVTGDARVGPAGRGGHGRGAPRDRWERVRLGPAALPRSRAGRPRGNGSRLPGRGHEARLRGDRLSVGGHVVGSSVASCKRGRSAGPATSGAACGSEGGARWACRSSTPAFDALRHPRAHSGRRMLPDPIRRIQECRIDPGAAFDPALPLERPH